MYGEKQYVGDDNLTLTLESAIQGGDNIHGKDRTGLLGAMSNHATSNRTKGMTTEDLQFAINALTQSDTMNYFQYNIPTA